MMRLLKWSALALLLLTQSAIALDRGGPPEWARMHQDRIQMEWKLYLMNSSWPGQSAHRRDMMSSNGRFLGSYATQALLPRRDLGDGPGAHAYIVIDDGMRLYLTDDHFDPDHVPPSGQRNGTVEFFADIAKLTKLTMEALDGTWSYKDAFDLSIGSAHQIGLKEGVPTSAIARAFASGQRR